MHYQIEVKHFEPTHTAVIRSRVRPEELSKFVAAACGEVWSFVRSAGLPKPGRHLALYVGDGQGSVEVGAEVGERFAGNDRVQCSHLPAGRVATAVHFGPYARLGEAHAAIPRVVRSAWTPAFQRFVGDLRPLAGKLEC